jgi:hypothetical protein
MGQQIRQVHKIVLQKDRKMKAHSLQSQPERDPEKRGPRLVVTAGLCIFVLMLFGCILMLFLYASQAHAEAAPISCAALNSHAGSGAPGAASEPGAPVFKVPQGRSCPGPSPDPKPVGRALDAPLDLPSS